jgi:Cu/Ag efflux pump CusA
VHYHIFRPMALESVPSAVIPHRSTNVSVTTVPATVYWVTKHRAKAASEAIASIASIASMGKHHC